MAGVKMVLKDKKLVAPIAIQSTPMEILNKALSPPIRYEAPQDTCVMSGCDVPHFPGFQMMYASLMLFHEVQVCFVDLGVEDSQLNWCLCQPNITVLRGLSGPFTRDKRAWQTWNKPFYMAQSPTKRVLWLDTDVVVGKDIRGLFGILNSQPVLNPDPNPSSTENLFKLLPINGIMKEMPPYINAGVIGLDLERDHELHEIWMYAVKEASTNPEIERAMKYYDQGAIKWAAYKCNANKYVLPDYRYDKIIGRKPTELCNFLNFVKRQPEHLIHCAGTIKYWQEWGTVIDFELDYDSLRDKNARNLELSKNFENRIKIFVLHDQEYMLKQIPNRSYLAKIDLSQLQVEEYRIPDLAECKFLMCDTTHDKEYTGLFTARWAKKYPKKIPLHKMYEIDPCLRADTVLCAETSTEWWKDKSPAVEDFLHQIANRTGRNICCKASPIDSNILCPTTVFYDWIRFWKNAFTSIYDIADTLSAKEIARLGRRITSLYFANRDDLIISLLDG